MLFKAKSHTRNILIVSIFPKYFIAAWIVKLSSSSEKLLTNLLILLADFLASPKKPVYSCIFKLLAGKACFRKYDCKYAKEINILELWVFLYIVFSGILAVQSNRNRKLTRSVFRLSKWSGITKLLSALKWEKSKTQNEISISINCYCANTGNGSGWFFCYSAIHTQLQGTQLLGHNWALQPVICKLDMSRPQGSLQ